MLEVIFSEGFYLLHPRPENSERSRSNRSGGARQRRLDSCSWWLLNTLDLKMNVTMTFRGLKHTHIDQTFPAAIVSHILILSWKLYLFARMIQVIWALKRTNCISPLNKLHPQYSGHILTQESAARMNECDNTAGLPATSRQLLLTRWKPRDGNILSKLIEKTPKNTGLWDMYAGPPVGRCIDKTRERKTNFLSIMYQAIVPSSLT